MTAALVIGTFLAVGALAVVLYPLFFGGHALVAPGGARAQAVPEGETAVQALREIEFDRETGKLSDADYAELKARYTQEAVDAMRRREHSASGLALSAAATGGPLTDDELEAAIRAYRSAPACAECGPRPEADAAFCSSCGRYLRDRCAGCGAPVGESDARFCTNCGQRLAA